MNLTSAFTQPLPSISPDVYASADFEAVAKIIYANAGILLHAGKSMLVYSRLSPLVREANCGTFANYIELMRDDPAELARAMAALTTNHTYFFREAHHFEHFEREVRPGLLQALAAGRPVRLWSAGCSSGEEAWSLAMTLLGGDHVAGRQIAAGDVRILGSDIAPDELKKARDAVYSEKEVAPVPSHFRNLWTAQDENSVTMAEEIRHIAIFRHLNLQNEWPMTRKFNAIFCRNVTIYFDKIIKEKLFYRFSQSISPGGYLYIGHSERVTGEAAAHFQLVSPTIYRRKST